GAAHVQLVVADARLERSPLLGQQPVPSEVPEHAEVILGVALPVLLEAGRTDARLGGHQDPGAGALHARLPGPFPRRHLAAAVELCSVLAEIPDVPLAVLRVPVLRPLGEPAVDP